MVPTCPFLQFQRYWEPIVLPAFVTTGFILTPWEVLMVVLGVVVEFWWLCLVWLWSSDGCVCHCGAEGVKFPGVETYDDEGLRYDWPRGSWHTFQVIRRGCAATVIVDRKWTGETAFCIMSVSLFVTVFLTGETVCVTFHHSFSNRWNSLFCIMSVSLFVTVFLTGEMVFCIMSVSLFVAFDLTGETVFCVMSVSLFIKFLLTVFSLFVFVVCVCCFLFLYLYIYFFLWDFLMVLLCLWVHHLKVFDSWKRCQIVKVFDSWQRCKIVWPAASLITRDQD